MAGRRQSPSERKSKPLKEAFEDNVPLLTYLQGVLASLHPTERRIGECVLADPERVVSSSIDQLSEACEASVGSIVGFCRRLGLKGFSQLKIALARELAQSAMPSGQSTDEGSLLERVFRFHAQSLTDTLRVNSNGTFERVVEALDRAHRIELFAVGLSFPVAYTAACKLALVGLPAVAAFDSHIQLINATQLKATDVGFGISCSGSTRETVQCMEVARRRSATTICLTNAMKSPITGVSDHCLYATPSEIKYFQAPLASRITQLSLVDVLFVALALKRKNKTMEQLQLSGEELLKRRMR